MLPNVRICQPVCVPRDYAPNEGVRLLACASCAMCHQSYPARTIVLTTNRTIVSRCQTGLGSAPMAKLRIFHVPMSSLVFKHPVEVPEDQSGHPIFRIVQAKPYDSRFVVLLYGVAPLL